MSNSFEVKDYIYSIFSKNIWNIVAVLGSRFSGFLLIVVLSTIFSVESFAIYSIFVGVAAFIVPLASFGLTNYLKAIYANGSKCRYYLWIICCKYIGFSIFPIMSILLLLVYLNPFNLHSSLSYFFLLPMAITGVSVSIINSFDILYESHISRFIYFCISGFIGIIMIFFLNDINPIDIFSTMLLLAICTTVTLVFAKMNEFRDSGEKYTKKSFFNHLQGSNKYLFHGVAILILSSSDRVMLGLFSNAYEVASYTVISQFGMAISAVSIIAEASYLNLVLRTKLLDRKHSVLLECANNLMPLVYFLGGLLLSFLYMSFVDSKYHDVLYLLYPIIGAYFIFYIYGVIVNILLANNVGKNIQVVTVFWSLLNVILNVFLLEKYGAMGATLTTVCCFYGMTLNLSVVAKLKGCNISSVYTSLLVAMFSFPFLIFICIHDINTAYLFILLIPVIFSFFKSIQKFNFWKKNYV